MIKMRNEQGLIMKAVVFYNYCGSNNIKDSDKLVRG